VFAGGAFHPPVAPAHTIPNLQDGFDENGIVRLSVLALARVAEGGRVVGVEPLAVVGERLMEELVPARARPLPSSPPKPPPTRSG
jgi:hypothetical protein